MPVIWLNDNIDHSHSHNNNGTSAGHLAESQGQKYEEEYRENGKGCYILESQGQWQMALFWGQQRDRSKQRTILLLERFSIV